MNHDEYQKEMNRLNLEKYHDIEKCERWGERVLELVKVQSPIMKLFHRYLIDPKEQAELQVNPQRNDHNPTLTFHPGHGVVEGTVMKNKVFIGPADLFEHKSGFEIPPDDELLRSFCKAHERSMINALLGYTEKCGWDVIHRVIEDRSFPITNIINLGETRFSRPLVVKLMRAAAPYVDKGYTPQIFISDKSRKEFSEWDVFGDGWDSPFEDIPQHVFADDEIFTSEWRGMPITSMKSLRTGDVYPSVDLVYMIMTKPEGNVEDAGLVMPLRQTETTGGKIALQMLVDPCAKDCGNVQNKVRFQAGFACTDPSMIFVGVISRPVTYKNGEIHYLDEAKITDNDPLTEEQVNLFDSLKKRVRTPMLSSNANHTHSEDVVGHAYDRDRRASDSSLEAVDLVDESQYPELIIKRRDRLNLGLEVTADGKEIQLVQEIKITKKGIYMSIVETEDCTIPIQPGECFNLYVACEDVVVVSSPFEASTLRHKGEAKPGEYKDQYELFLTSPDFTVDFFGDAQEAFMRLTPICQNGVGTLTYQPDTKEAIGVKHSDIPVELPPHIKRDQREMADRAEEYLFQKTIKSPADEWPQNAPDLSQVEHRINQEAWPEKRLIFDMGWDHRNKELKEILNAEISKNDKWIKDYEKVADEKPVEHLQTAYSKQIEHNTALLNQDPSEFLDQDKSKPSMADILDQVVEESTEAELYAKLEMQENPDKPEVSGDLNDILNHFSDKEKD